MTPKEFRAIRRAKEITQQEVADAIGVNKSTICRFEKESKDIAFAAIKKIQEYAETM